MNDEAPKPVPESCPACGAPRYGGRDDSTLKQYACQSVAQRVGDGDIQLRIDFRCEMAQRINKMEKDINAILGRS